MVIKVITAINCDYIGVISAPTLFIIFYILCLLNYLNIPNRHLLSTSGTQLTTLHFISAVYRIHARTLNGNVATGVQMHTVVIY